ncbi:MAG: flagellar biosynthesis anti-sigma factor FlgM [Rhodocyclaceae bacterium]|nr:flagellar biosynthesis anti-sigma factor FlgM [Rhodocyclaceae bacterium]
MKIDNSIKTVGGVSSSDTRTRSVQGGGASSSASAGDKVELSSLSSTLQQAETAMAQVPVVDQSKVDEIKQAMSQGRFKVDAEKVADGLIESVRQMLDAQASRA